MKPSSTMPSLAKEHYDIVIAGGGMVGVSLACALAAADESSALSILLVDNFPIKKPVAGESRLPPEYHPSFDSRSTALSMASIEIYQAIGVLNTLLKHAEPIKQIHVSDRGHSGSALLDAEEQDLDAFGYVIENQWLGAVLLDRLSELPAVELCTGASAINVIPKSGGVSVDIAAVAKAQATQGSGDSGNADNSPSDKTFAARTINTNLLVVADGAQSGLRDGLGISATVQQYDQVAVIANLQTQLPHRGLAFERFTADGAVAFLPLPDLPAIKNRSALVWTLPADSLAAADRRPSDLVSADEQEFIARLQRVFGHRLGNITRVGQRQSYPLSLTIADEMIRSHIVLMGNSAHALHPVAGQGFNLALRDVAVIAEKILLARRHNKDIGSLDILESYADSRVKDHNLTIGFSHFLIELFGMQSLPVQVGRSLGLIALDLFKPAKAQFVRQATGLGGRRSSL